ncbi:MAG: SDR family NAD(P)-dependent oxidoreductase [Kiritimatiellae bacterium]|nr:SDR family NAD(P)-dependent oxidoreductase [Kiritimatiellia bacterium]
MNNASPDMPDMEFQHKVALVTGGAKGIGLAIANALAARGATVIAADVSIAASADMQSLPHAPGILGARVDVSDEASVLALFATILDRFAAVDIVVSSAGIFRTATIPEISAAEWDRVMAVNLRGTFLVGREAFKQMRERRAGRIVNLASTAGKTGGATAQAHYAASKAGVICFTKSLAREAAPYHVNVNAVAPGPTETDLTASWSPAVRAASAAAIPWGEFAQPQDVAEAVVFLVSDRARYLTGEILDVNGGMVMD